MIAPKTKSNASKLIKMARILPKPIRCIQLQKGKKRVANMPPITNGIKKPLARIKTATINTKISSFLRIELRFKVILVKIF